jgi:sugar O-acyltransferase (sialic acid O-acetyltransferase NeuD family)
VEKAYIYGAGGHGKVVAELLEFNNELVFLDDAKAGQSIWKYSIKNISECINDTLRLVIGIGTNRVRKLIANQLEGKVVFINAIHKSAIVSNRVKILEGTVIMAGSVINCDTIIGKHCIINTSASVDHDCIVSDFAHISPNATLCGNVSVGEGTYIGAGSVIIQGVNIGKWCTIGASAVIIRDTPDYATVVGNPGRIIKISKIDE